MEIYQVTIKNWDKWNARTDVKRNWYFKFSNDFFSQHDFSGLSPTCIVVWLYLLCLCSKSASSRIQVSIKSASSQTQLRASSIRHALQLFESIGKLSLKRNEFGRKRIARVEKSREEKRRVYNTLKAEKIENLPVGASVKETSPLNLGHVISCYIKAYEQRYGARPAIGGKEQGILKRLAKDYRPDKLGDLVQVYVHMNNSWFQTKMHDLSTLEQNIQAVLVALQTGKESGRKYKTLAEIYAEEGKDVPT